MGSATVGMMDDITAKYTGFEAWAYDAVVAPAVARAFLARFGDDGLMDDDSAGRLLDVGCGGGQIALELARRHPGVHVTGLDFSEDQIRRADRRAGALANVEFVVGNALDLPFADDSFETVISVACIKHWPDRMLGLRECRRVLKPGGRFVLVEADRGFDDGDIGAFASGWSIPAPLRAYGAGLFRKHIADRSLTLEEAEALYAQLDWARCDGYRVDGRPAFVIRSRK